MLNESICWSPGITLRDVELQTVRFAYRFYKENKTSTAKSLGISVRTLDAKLAELRTMEKRAEWVAMEKKREGEMYLYRARGQEIPAHLLEPTPGKPDDDFDETEALTLPKRQSQSDMQHSSSAAIGV